MSKKHEREEDVVSRLEKENRELKGLVRSLQSRLKKVDKEFKAELEEANKELHLKKDHTPKSKKCSECAKGDLIYTELLGRMFIRCSLCEFKSRGK